MHYAFGIFILHVVRTGFYIVTVSALDLVWCAGC